MTRVSKGFGRQRGPAAVQCSWLGSGRRKNRAQVHGRGRQPDELGLAGLAGCAYRLSLVHESGPARPAFRATKDRELRAASLGWRLGECTAWRSQALALALQLAPRLQLGAWQARQGEPRRLVDAAFIPALRWDLGSPAAGLRLDLELGIGAGLISHSRIGERQKSTNFQFFDVMGLGLRSADSRWRLSLDYRHVSNADIRKPNQAVDFIGLSVEVPMP